MLPCVKSFSLSSPKEFQLRGWGRSITGLKLEVWATEWDPVCMLGGSIVSDSVSSILATATRTHASDYDSHVLSRVFHTLISVSWLLVIIPPSLLCCFLSLGGGEIDVWFRTEHPTVIYPDYFLPLIRFFINCHLLHKEVSLILAKNRTNLWIQT